jgi:hypothetical protein
VSECHCEASTMTRPWSIRAVEHFGRGGGGETSVHHHIIYRLWQPPYKFILLYTRVVHVRGMLFTRRVELILTNSTEMSKRRKTYMPSIPPRNRQTNRELCTDKTSCNGQRRIKKKGSIFASCCVSVHFQLCPMTSPANSTYKYVFGVCVCVCDNPSR